MNCMYGSISRYKAAYIKKRGQCRNILGVCGYEEVSDLSNWKVRDGGWGAYLCNSETFVIWN